ncbi:MAG: NADH-quinone oxidoreductase subunit L [Oscillochloris sp.]|nr:NADH-quinone oxidoreductase subunit L [Oscillochloris sp.]
MDLSELQAIAGREQSRSRRWTIRCCTSSGCQAAQAHSVKARLNELIADLPHSQQIEVREVGCMGCCGQGPMVAVDPDRRMYHHVTAAHAPQIVAALSGNGDGLPQLDPESPFFTRQVLVVRKNGGLIDPERIEAAIGAGAYRALYHALHEYSPAEVIDLIQRSGLRGRGGAGYPTGLKWATVAKSPGRRKFVVCNGDEGDPGAFMDRSVLESDPHLVLEGMAIAAYAVGADQGYVYVRGEYPLAITRLNKAIIQAKKYGLLGSQIFDSAFDFKVEIRVGAGAFVCGEETALIASIEGRRGQPRPRPPYPAERGLWGCPTLINNVETFANITAILDRGPEWFASIGVPGSTGTKVFALTGAIRNPGLIEVPMGISIHTIVEEMGGGAAEGRQLKAVQTGGPSGGCIPANLFDTPVDYESLAALGSIMGSGGMVVLDSNNSMVDMARFYMEFCRDESCGKCAPCRVGTVQLHLLLQRIAAGEGSVADIAQMEELCALVRDTSLCGLGQSAPNPVLSTLRFFRHEYDELLIG